MEIQIKKLSNSDISKMGISNWPIWEKEISKFEWTYDEEEQFYLIEGKVSIIAGEKEYEILPGDFVTCPKGLDCNWEIKENVKKHYQVIGE